MATMDPFRDEARNRGIPEAEVERWLETVRPCAALYWTDDHAGGPVAGFLDGQPDVTVPGKPFLALVNLAAVPADATDIPLPPDGTLLFFADFDDPDPDVDWHQLVYLPAGTAVAMSGEPAELGVRVEPSLPNRGADSAEFPHGDELGSVWWETKGQMGKGGAVKLGGYPWVWNADPVTSWDHDPDDDWVLLATITSGEQFGSDLGMAHWVIRRADLAARRFDRAEAYYDSFD
ncbi:DUF1963 domain-containing protein [Actinoplanes sp. NBRC 103695]|uniref:DUF1963 domain-containing protein n=1 Tax=Actinoplanes sp. NBRC 103695 TaxID=3032202 RepID=UPI0025541C6F|nr:DUF1963 domain-containing protein [Actinoplanes sp. NBRC 103695]